MKKMRLYPSSALAFALLFFAVIGSTQDVPQGGPPAGKQALAAGKFADAKTIYESYLHTNPGSLPGELGLADAELGLHEYETAELEYRKITEAQPELWIAHKNLVLIEAKLGRWDEFDRERDLLRGARERGAPGISMRESDVIDSFDVPAREGKPAMRWIVREYFEPVGRSLTRYNFEQFSPTGKAEEYISLESAQAAQQALSPEDTHIGTTTTTPHTGSFELNFYTSKGHGTIASYPKSEPPYKAIRAAVLRWLRRQN